jgi:hypothetical protein
MSANSNDYVLDSNDDQSVEELIVEEQTESAFNYDGKWAKVAASKRAENGMPTNLSKFSLFQRNYLYAIRRQERQRSSSGEIDNSTVQFEPLQVVQPEHLANQSEAYSYKERVNNSLLAMALEYEFEGAPMPVNSFEGSLDERRIKHLIDVYEKLKPGYRTFYSSKGYVGLCGVKDTLVCSNGGIMCTQCDASIGRTIFLMARHVLICPGRNNHKVCDSCLMTGEELGLSTGTYKKSLESHQSICHNDHPRQTEFIEALDQATTLFPELFATVATWPVGKFKLTLNKLKEVSIDLGLTDDQLRKLFSLLTNDRNKIKSWLVDMLGRNPSGRHLFPGPRTMLTLLDAGAKLKEIRWQQWEDIIAVSCYGVYDL